MKKDIKQIDVKLHNFIRKQSGFNNGVYHAVNGLLVKEKKVWPVCGSAIR